MRTAESFRKQIAERYGEISVASKNKLILNSSDKEKSKTAEIAKNVGAVMLVVVFVAVGVAALAALVLY